MSKGQQKFDKVMHEWGQNKLVSSSGHKVKYPSDRPQALAIAFSSARAVEPSFGNGGQVQNGEKARGGFFDFGRPNSAIARDKKYLSQEPHEQAYAPHRKSVPSFYKSHAKGGKTDNEVKKLYDKALDLLGKHINNGGSLDFSEKEYGYLNDDLDAVAIGYFNEKPDGDNQQELADENYKISEKDAIETLEHRIENIESELQFAKGGVAIKDYIVSGGGLAEPTKISASSKDDAIAEAQKMVRHAFGSVPKSHFTASEVSTMARVPLVDDVNFEVIGNTLSGRKINVKGKIDESAKKYPDLLNYIIVRGKMQKKDYYDLVKSGDFKIKLDGEKMARGGEIKEGEVYHIDTYRVSQYEETRFVDDVTIEETPKKTDKKVLVYSPKYMANVLVYKSDLRNKSEDESDSLATGGGVEDIEKSLYVAELYDNGNLMGYTVRDKFNVSGKYTLSSKKERAEENRQYLIDNPSRLAYYRKNEYASGGTTMASGGGVGEYIVKYWEAKKDFNKGEAKDWANYSNTDHAMQQAQLLLNDKKMYAVEVYNRINGETFWHSEEEYSSGGSMATGGGVSEKNITIDNIVSILNNLDGNGITFEDDKEVRKELNNYSLEKLKRYSKEVPMNEEEYKKTMLNFLNYLDGRGIIVEDDDSIVRSLATGGLVYLDGVKHEKFKTNKALREFINTHRENSNVQKIEVDYQNRIYPTFDTWVRENGKLVHKGELFQKNIDMAEAERKRKATEENLNKMMGMKHGGQTQYYANGGMTDEKKKIEDKIKIIKASLLSPATPELIKAQYRTKLEQLEKQLADMGRPAPVKEEVSVVTEVPVEEKPIEEPKPIAEAITEAIVEEVKKQDDVALPEEKAKEGTKKLVRAKINGTFEGTIDIEGEGEGSARNITVPGNKTYYIDIEPNYRNLIRNTLDYNDIEYTSKTMEDKTYKVFVSTPELLERVFKIYNMKRAHKKDAIIEDISTITGKFKRGGKVWIAKADKKEKTLRNKAMRMGLIKGQDDKLSEKDLNKIAKQSKGWKKCVEIIRAVNQVKHKK